MNRCASTGRERPGACRRQEQAGITLVELLVTMAILGVVTTMIFAVWFALQNSYAYSSDASHQREAARDALARMTLTIRGAQDTSFAYQAQAPAISVAESQEIVFNTSYGQPDNANVSSGSSGNSTSVVQACYIYVPSASTPADGKIYYVVDQNNNGVADEAQKPSTYGQVIVDNVVNNVRPPTTSPTSVFTYTYFGDDGTIKQVTSMSAANVSPARIYSVQIRVLVDLKPGHAPVYMDLQSSAQPRNMRPST